MGGQEVAFLAKGWYTHSSVRDLLLEGSPAWRERPCPRNGDDEVELEQKLTSCSGHLMRVIRRAVGKGMLPYSSRAQSSSLLPGNLPDRVGSGEGSLPGAPMVPSLSIHIVTTSLIV